MDQHPVCDRCGNRITEQGLKCLECGTFFGREVIFCRRCFGTSHCNRPHTSIPVDYTQTTNTELINSVIQFENSHLHIATANANVFPDNDGNSVIWKRHEFSKISYLSPTENSLLKNSIPFVCDYLRMNNSLKYLVNTMKLNVCSTDIIILIFKYSPLHVRSSIFEQLCMFQRPIPIYFGVPCHEDSSMKYYLLMQEVLQALLPYIHQNLPFVLSFGTSVCKGKTKLLNNVLKTNFDCHSATDFMSELASVYYHNQLIQMVLGHQYATDRQNNLCHVLDLHGTHVWNKMPNFLIRFMSVIMIHIDISDTNQTDSLEWPSVVYNETAMYFVFIHGNVTQSELETNLKPKLLKYFGANRNKIYILSVEAHSNTLNRSLELVVLDLLKQASMPHNSLLDVSKQLLEERKINLSTNIGTFIENRSLLHEFYEILKELPEQDPALVLFPLSRLKELSEKTNLTPEQEKEKEKLKKNLNKKCFDDAHILLTKLAQLSISQENSISLFEKAVLFWNAVLSQRNQTDNQASPTSILQQFEMSKERFLREFQIRCEGYVNLNGRQCLFNDSNRMRLALISIYRNSFQHQEYIEVINATSTVTYPRIFEETFADNSHNLREFFVIGIIGEQSSGKSFLINKVFGTKIAESKFKCTTGILATRVNVAGHEHVKNLVILDTEGLLDASKQDFEAQIFDRKIVLEVMARSHVILINIARNVNKIMQQILEIVIYGLNKLHITNKPKIIFLFRDQAPNTMGDAGQRDHVKQVMADINTTCRTIDFNAENMINGFDIHEFPSPFAILFVGEREISFFNNNFCRQALALRSKVIEQLASLTPFDSFKEWITLTLDLWEQINHNSNLFDYESLIHLTLEKALEAFCNRVLTEANKEMTGMIDPILNNKRRNKPDLRQLSEQLDEMKERCAQNILTIQLKDEKQRLMKLHNLQSFSEILLGITEKRIKSSLNLYARDHYMIVERQLQQDEYEQKLSDIPKILSQKISEVQNLVSNTEQFETLFVQISTQLLNQFIRMLENDYKEHSIDLQKQLIQNFRQQNQIDNVGVNYFNTHIHNPSLIDIVCKTVIEERSVQREGNALALVIPDCINSFPTGSQNFRTIEQGQGLLRRFASAIRSLVTRNNRRDHHEEEQQIEKMLSFLKMEYIVLRNASYYDNNLLPVTDLANLSVQHIGDAIRNNHVGTQELSNIWYTCYGIMLNVFCEEHYNYIRKTLEAKFKQEISRTKEQVKQNITNATTAEEHGQALIKQIRITIENDAQKQFQNQFERFFDTWDTYRPSVIAENCVNQLFQSKNYQEIFDYIRDPSEYVFKWLFSRFYDKYEVQLKQTMQRFSTHLQDTRTKFSRMILCWCNTFSSTDSDKNVTQLMDSLKVFLADGEYKEDDILLKEPSGGFAILIETEMRMIPETADKSRLVGAIRSASMMNSTDEYNNIEKSTKDLLTDKLLKDRLFDRFYNKAKGCGIPCPYCKQMCDCDNPAHDTHRCDNHLLWIFAGYRNRNTGYPSLVTCTSNDAFSHTVQSPLDKNTYVPFSEHLSRFNPNWKIINQMTNLQDYMLKAYIALEEDLAKLYQFDGRANNEIRKRFLRSTTTTHCHALVVGIDYEDTPDSLGNIPSHDAECIADQLKLSSIAFAENLHVLKNSEATYDNILDKLEKIVDNMDQRSTFLFYFAGHGERSKARKSYLITVDDEHLSVLEIVKTVCKAKTNKIIIILDSCFSGGVDSRISLHSCNIKEGIHILASSRPDEISYQDKSNGFFTKYLIGGLKGKFECEKTNCSDCARRRTNLEEAPIRKVTSTELITYLTHAVTNDQHFSYSAINGSEFDISFCD